MLVLFACLTMNAQQTFFSWNFNNGIPEDFALYDLDQNKPSTQAKEFGFEVGKPWISQGVMQDPSDLSIMSTSSYSPTGTSNDWIVTPAIPVSSEYTCFEWVAANLTAKKDSYKILISTKGQTVEDFNDAEVLYEATKGEQEPGYIFPHAVSLKKYINNTVYIAVINNSTNQSFLVMDDFEVKEIYENLTFYNITQNVITDNSATKTTIACRLANPELIPFKQDVVVELTVGDEKYTQDLTSFTLGSYEYRDIKFDVDAPLTGESVNYTLKAVYTAAPQDESIWIVNSALHRIGSTYSRKVVTEECTGTWCGYCPRGAVGMSTMREKYPEDFIGIAVHNDIMQVDEYMQGMSSFISGFPSGVVNRSVVIDPSAANLERQYKKEIVKPSPASLKITDVEFTSSDSTQVKVKISSAFAFNTERGSNNFNFAFVVIENDVRGTTSDYNQVNYYAGGRQGKMGGYELLPSTVPASKMVYQEVARGIVDTFNGIANSVPQNIVKDQEFTYEYTFDLPQTIMKKRYVEIIALLLDNTSGEIWNADKYAIDPTTGIESPQSVNSSAKIYVSGEDLLISLNSETIQPVYVELYSLDGKKVKEAYFENALNGLSMYVGDLQGIYVVKVNNGKNIAVKKVVL